MQTDLTRDQKLQKQQNENYDLKLQQIKEANGEADPDLIVANMNKAYKIKAAEQNYVHVKLVHKTHNERAKSYDVSEKIDQYHERDFEKMVNAGAFGLFDEVEVIHHPKEKEYTAAQLKPNQLDIDKKTVDTDPNAVSLKEKKLAQKEKEVSKRLDEIEKKDAERDALWTKLNEENAKKQKELDDLIAKQKEALAAAEKKNTTGNPGA